MNERPMLLVDDSTEDVFLCQRAIAEAQLANPLHVALSGREAMQYLEGQGEFGDRKAFPFPALLLLDLKLPIVSGIDLLHWIRSHPSLRMTIVIVLTSAADERAMSEAYAAGANSYLIKPASSAAFAEMIAAVARYWLIYNRFPSLPQ